jgi:formamidopyrimidine-DNA glycosylase
MPELPEVETVRLGLNKFIVGKRVEAVDYNWPKGFPNKPEDVKKHLLGATIVVIRRRAKVLIIDLSTKYSLVIHLKMTGQLVYRAGQEAFGAGHPTDSLVGELPDRSTRVTFKFKDGTNLFFNDQRKFGWVRLLPTAEVEELDFFKKVGPEPLESSFKPEDFIVRIRRRGRSNIKAVLLDQTIIAGVGNIYADESLFAARIHPSTIVQKLTDSHLAKLYSELCAILREAILKGGSTDRNYVNAEGKRGNYLSFAKVFRRDGQPCLRCGELIVKIRVAGRGTHICPHCQQVAQIINYGHRESTIRGTRGL